MPLVDPTLHQVSACPVHFIWDGRGRGRAFVRAGFLASTVAAAAWVLGMMSHSELATNAGLGLAALAGASWCAGQVMSWFAARAWKRSLVRSREAA